MDFHVGSGLAALTEIGNVVHDLRVYGGRYGILTTNTSPFWPFTVLEGDDASLDAGKIGPAAHAVPSHDFH